MRPSDRRLALTLFTYLNPKLLPALELGRRFELALGDGFNRKRPEFRAFDGLRYQNAVSHITSRSRGFTLYGRHFFETWSARASRQQGSNCNNRKRPHTVLPKRQISGGLLIT